MKLSINGSIEELQEDIDKDMPLLWVLRDILGHIDVKFGCGVASCGACSIHIDGEAVRSCVYPVSLAVGKKITTISGIVKDGLHPVQEAWIEHEVAQCGYCQVGQIMTAVSFLQKYPNPSDEDIKNNMTNICRCGTYPAIKQAIYSASKNMKTKE